MAQNEIKVSIVIPIYNVGQFFKDCMESVLSQSHRNIEVVLVDDGSTDNSGQIADGYAIKDKRVKVVHLVNSGVSRARNVGIENATGKYICFSDPDDILKKDYVEYMLSLCEDNQAEVSVCAEVFTTFMPSQRVPNIQIVDGEEAAAQILYGKITVGCYSKMFRRDFLNNNKVRFFEDVYIGEGFNFNVLAFCLAERVAVSQHKVYWYRLDNSASAMSKFNIEKCAMGLKAIDVIRQNLRIKSQKLYDAVDYADWSTHGSMYDWMVMANVKRSYPEMYKKCKVVTHRLSTKAIFAPTTKKMRIMAILRFIHPFLWASLRFNVRRLAEWRKSIKMNHRTDNTVSGGGKLVVISCSDNVLPQNKLAA